MPESRTTRFARTITTEHTTEVAQRTEVGKEEPNHRSRGAEDINLNINLAVPVRYIVLYILVLIIYYYTVPYKLK